MVKQFNFALKKLAFYKYIIILIFIGGLFYNIFIKNNSNLFFFKLSQCLKI